MPGGEPDLMRQGALQAWVQTGSPDVGSGGLHVRGGNADQNLILLDDVPVYNPGHALGLFSIFKPLHHQQCPLLEGDQPARYGGRAASVLDIRTRDWESPRLRPHCFLWVGLRPPWWSRGLWCATKALSSA